MVFQSEIKKNLIIASIPALLILLAGCILNGGTSSSVTPGSYEIDSRCEIQEYNLSIVHNQTAIPITDEELKLYPEFEMYLNDTDNDPRAWNFGTRLVKDFDCNSSRTYQFFNFS